MRTLLRPCVALVACGLAFALASCVDSTDPLDDYDVPTGGDYVVPPVANPAPPWPEWVLRPWVWEDESTAESAAALVQGYQDHGIPVGAVIIDSPWETGYNTFLFAPDRYPDPRSMVEAFHAAGVRVFLWATSTVNLDSPNYLEGFNGGYYLNNGRTIAWWKGRGSYLDYTNPEAVAWWHAQMDYALDLGIDGWKVDMTDDYLRRWGTLSGYAGAITIEEYQDLYYRDFFTYTRERLGNDRVITARPVDAMGKDRGDDFAPVDVSFAAWVGDQEPTWDGLRGALANYRLSAEKGYVNFGSDIGGYMKGDVLRDPELFLRWTELGALSPIMENGGQGEHRPWMYDAVTLDVYRAYANLHAALLPYLYSEGARSYREGVSLVRFLPAGKDHYLLGASLLVAPIAEPTPELAVTFPAGTWIDWWSGIEIAGDSVYWMATPLDVLPIFVRRGAILPLDLRERTVFADHSGDRPPLTVYLYPDPGRVSAFDVHEEKGDGARVEMDAADLLTVRLSATDRAYAFRVVLATAPARVESEGVGDLKRLADREALTAADSGWAFDPLTRELWVKPGDAGKGIAITVR
jgi:alpha-glucosidase (family GH31 glycosyl hydrolase)